MNTTKIAVAGKGGVGKTTIVCGIVTYLISKNETPILIVDADPNSNLAENLGVKYESTIADIREELKGTAIPQGMAKTDYINFRLQEVIVEHKGFDLIIMGRPEGRECYCYVNELLRNFLSNIAKNYKYVVIDTEAGMEHLSRRTTDNIDYLFIIATPTKVALDTAKKIFDLTPKLKLKILNKKLILNLAESKIELKYDLPLAGILSKDPEIQKMSQEGSPLLPNIYSTKFYTELSILLKKNLK